MIDLIIGKSFIFLKQPNLKTFTNQNHNITTKNVLNLKTLTNQNHNIGTKNVLNLKTLTNQNHNIATKNFNSCHQVLEHLRMRQRGRGHRVLSKPSCNTPV